MKRLLVLGAVLLGLVLLNPALSGTAQAPGKDAPYVHCVIFHLKKDAPKDATTGMIADASKLLAKIPTVRNVKIGPPAKEATPKFAVSDYQLGLVVLFDDYNGLKTYLDHPLHLKYVENHEKHIEKVIVYDFINQAK